MERGFEVNFRTEFENMSLNAKCGKGKKSGTLSFLFSLHDVTMWFYNDQWEIKATLKRCKLRADEEHMSEEAIHSLLHLCFSNLTSLKDAEGTANRMALGS